MNQQLMISVKQEPGDHTPKLDNRIQNPHLLETKVKPRKSRTGIDIPKFREIRKSLSKSSSYKGGDTYLRMGDHEEL